MVVIKENSTSFHAISGSKVTWLFHAMQTNREAGGTELKKPECIGDDFPQGSEETYPANPLSSKYIKNKEGIH